MPQTPINNVTTIREQTEILLKIASIMNSLRYIGVYTLEPSRLSLRYAVADYANFIITIESTLLVIKGIGNNYRKFEIANPNLFDNVESYIEEEYDRYDCITTLSELARAPIQTLPIERVRAALGLVLSAKEEALKKLA